MLLERVISNLEILPYKIHLILVTTLGPTMIILIKAFGLLGKESTYVGSNEEGLIKRKWHLMEQG